MLNRSPAPFARLRRVITASFVLFAWACPLAAQQLREDLKARIEMMRSSASLRLFELDHPSSEVLATLYELRAFAPLWQDPARRAALRVAVSMLADDGLDPASYRLAQLVADGNTNPARWTAEADLLHSFVLLMAATHLRYGALDAETLVPRRAPADALIHDASFRELADTDPIVFLERMRPQHFAYTGLSNALRRLQRIHRAGGWQPVGAMLRMGSVDSAVIRLRLRLMAEGDLQPDEAALPDVFDLRVENAVRAFQHRYGLTVDGIVGPVTLDALDRPVQERIDQIAVNLERGRWLLHDLPLTFVAVNIAGAVAYVVQDGQVTFETPVIVGADATRTPIFTATLRYIDLNPTWTVPPGIVHEVLAAVRRDPGYLDRQRMLVIDASGRVVPAADIDFHRYTARTFPYVFRQEPGPLNPLGSIKFVFPNRHNVYMHDTPARDLFSRDRRTFSHGCVRVQDPLRLAALLLQDTAWTADAISAAIATGRQRTLTLPEAVPVMIQYWTASTDLHGELHMYRDVYHRDPAMLSALRAWRGR